MVASWLQSLSDPRFQRARASGQPHAEPNTAGSVVPLFDWDCVEQILSAESSNDVIATAAGKPLALPAPRELIEVRALLRSGIGLVIRRAENATEELSELAESIAQGVPGDVHIQLFITPGDSHSFGWHYDFEEVLIVQTVGTKDYFFRENTVDLDTPPTAQPDFSRVRQETSPVLTARLVAGDWLYLPPRWWHAARSREHSLSISIGVFSDWYA